jgi:hypothetical protein
MRNAARRGESAIYTLNVSLEGGGGPFEERLALQDIEFHVTSANADSANTLRIVPTGLEVDSSPIERPIEGRVTGAEVGDLNVDGSPEVYVYVVAPGPEARGSLVAYGANRRRSLSEIYLPPLEQTEGATEGYRGHDEFAVVENTFARRFPVYEDSDGDGAPTGGMRQLQYRLEAGEAGWVLTVDRMVEY